MGRKRGGAGLALKDEVAWKDAEGRPLVVWWVMGGKVARGTEECAFDIPLRYLDHESECAVCSRPFSAKA